MVASLACFKAYDVRGKVPRDLDVQRVRAIGRALALEGARRVVIGHDARLSGPELAAALALGLADGGCDVTSLGLCCTEEIYFASARTDGDGALLFDAGVMVTGSHNPADENGLKFVRGGAIPVSGDTGLFRLRDRAAELLASGAVAATLDGAPACRDIGEENRQLYLDFLGRFFASGAGVPGERPLRVHIDPGNGCAGLVAGPLCDRLQLDWTAGNMEPDGHFPNGIPNPLLPDRRSRTARAVRDNRADMGLAWDGDADRCFFYDGEGNFIEGYYLVGLLAEVMLERCPGARIIHDPRLYWNTVDVVRSHGGIPVQSRTGHAFIKESMRAEDAVYGGEMSAHHYFREFFYCDSGMLPWLLVARLLAGGTRSLAERVAERMRLYPCSGEINSTVADAAAVMDRVRARYAAGALREEHVDGLSLEFADWRFNLRSSNTEPLLRLNVESRGDRALMEDRTGELLALIRG